MCSSTKRCPSLAQTSDPAHRHRIVKNPLLDERKGSSNVPPFSKCGWVSVYVSDGLEVSTMLLLMAVRHRAVQEDQLKVLQQAHSECFESTTVHFIVLIISQGSEMQPLSRCWFTEWMQLSQTSKYCKYAENGSSKTASRCCVWLWYSSGKGTAPWWVNRKWHFRVKWGWFVI